MNVMQGGLYEKLICQAFFIDKLFFATQLFRKNMFTGIIKYIGTVFENTPQQDGKNLTIRIPHLKNQEIGDSISIMGCCLTVTNIHGDIFSFYVSAETLKQTTLAMLIKGQSVNAEPAMLASTPLGGHMVSGHVDEVAKIVDVQLNQNTHKLYVEVSPQGKKWAMKKGSIAIDGVSLTVMNIQGKVVELNVIPHTLQNTTLKNIDAISNNLVNVEFDQMTKIIAKKIDEHFAGR
jgi:riboflavin synthase